MLWPYPLGPRKDSYIVWALCQYFTMGTTVVDESCQFWWCQVWFKGQNMTSQVGLYRWYSFQRIAQTWFWKICSFRNNYGLLLLESFIEYYNFVQWLCSTFSKYQCDLVYRLNKVWVVLSVLSKTKTGSCRCYTSMNRVNNSSNLENNYVYSNGIQ